MALVSRPLKHDESNVAERTRLSQREVAMITVVGRVAVEGV
jgi:hypothetical protein